MKPEEVIVGRTVYYFATGSSRPVQTKIKGRICSAGGRQCCQIDGHAGVVDIRYLSLTTTLDPVPEQRVMATSLDINHEKVKAPRPRSHK